MAVRDLKRTNKSNTISEKWICKQNRYSNDIKNSNVIVFSPFLLLFLPFLNLHKLFFLYIILLRRHYLPLILLFLTLRLRILLFLTFSVRFLSCSLFTTQCAFRVWKASTSTLHLVYFHVDLLRVHCSTLTAVLRTSLSARWMICWPTWGQRSNSWMLTAGRITLFRAVKDFEVSFFILMLTRNISERAMLYLY